MLIYLLPGFLGLWVFKNMVQEDIDRRGEEYPDSYCIAIVAVVVEIARPV